MTATVAFGAFRIALDGEADRVVKELDRFYGLVAIALFKSPTLAETPVAPAGTHSY